MGRELTQADVEQWQVRYEDGGTEQISAAYVTTDPPQGTQGVQAATGHAMGFVTFKDWRHKVVAMVPAHLIRNIRRCEPAGG